MREENDKAYRKRWKRRDRGIKERERERKKMGVVEKEIRNRG